MSLPARYADVPIVGRFGNGCYSFILLVDGDETGTQKYEIYANEWSLALEIIHYNLSPVVEWFQSSADTINIVLGNGFTGTAVLYCA